MAELLLDISHGRVWMLARAGYPCRRASGNGQGTRVLSGVLVWVEVTLKVGPQCPSHRVP